CKIGILASLSFFLASAVLAIPIISGPLFPALIKELLRIKEHLCWFAQFNIDLATSLCRDSCGVRYDKKTATLRVLFTNIRAGKFGASSLKIGRASCRERV